MRYSPTENEIEAAADLLVNKYNISTQLLGQLIGANQVDKVNDILRKYNNTRLSKFERAKILIYRDGVNVFSGSSNVVRSLRKKLLDQLAPEVISDLYVKHGNNNNIKSHTHMSRPLSIKKWHAGGIWSNDFVKALGFPPIFAGVHQRDAKPSFEDIAPREIVPELVEFQKGLKEEMLKVLEKDGRKTRCIVTLPTGGGKTRVAVEAFIDWMIPHFSEGKYMIWIAQSEELCEQVISCLEALWKDREFLYPLRIYRFFGGREINVKALKGGVAVCSIQQLHNRRKNSSTVVDILLSNTGAMIIDEAHRTVSKMYDGLINRAEELCGRDLFPICGLSATPGRTGKQEEIIKLVDRFFSYLIKPDLGVEYRSDPLKYFREHQFLAQAKHIVINSKRKYTVTDDDLQESETGEDYEFAPVFLNKLANDNNRNFKIIQELKRIPKDNPTLVYACTVEQAHFISMILTSLGRPAGVIDSDTPMTIRRGLLQDFKNNKIQFLCNYGVLTTGFDAPKTSYIVITRPTTSQILYEQIVGRGLRGTRFGGTKWCTIIDFTDNLGRHGKALAYARFSDFWDEEIHQ